VGNEYKQTRKIWMKQLFDKGTTVQADGMTGYNKQCHTEVNRQLKMYTVTKTFEFKMSPARNNDVQFDCQNS
jgi:hypothetical protein